MAAAVLREGGLTWHHQLALGIGARKSRYRDNDRLSIEQRLAGFLGGGSWHDLPEGVFKHAGTRVSTALLVINA